MRTDPYLVCEAEQDLEASGLEICVINGHNLVIKCTVFSFFIVFRQSRLQALGWKSVEPSGTALVESQLLGPESEHILNGMSQLSHCRITVPVAECRRES